MYKNKDSLLEFPVAEMQTVYDEGVRKALNESENEGQTANILYFLANNFHLMLWQQKHHIFVNREVI